MVKTNAISGLISNGASSLLTDLQPIKPPVPILNVWLWVWVVAGLLLLLALAWWWWRRRKLPPPAAAVVPVIPPHEKARARLSEALGLIDQAQPFCILVSDTIRIYLEERFNLRAPDRTTEEFLEELQSSALLSLEQKRTLGEFLMGCDLVKFARYEPARAELEAIYEAAVRLVDETEAPPPAPAPSPGIETAPPSP